MKPTLLLISGWAYPADSLQPFADQLKNWVDTELLSGMELLKSKQVPTTDYILGWSMGGMLAMELLPPTTKKLILLSSTARFCAAENYPCGISEKALRLMVRQLKRDPEAVLDQFHKNVHAPNPIPRIGAPSCSSGETPEGEQARRLQNNKSNTASALGDGLNYLLQTDLRAIAPRIKIPTLILHSTQDQIIPSAAGEWLHQAIPNSKWALIGDQGHAIPPEELITTLQPFLADA